MSQFFVASNAGNLPSVVVETLTGNTGGAVGPDGSHNINVVGNNTANNGYATWIAGTPGTFTLKSNSYGLAKWVVNPIAGVGTHQTITAALAAASSGDDIFITSGTYVESFSLVAGVNLNAFLTDQETPTVIIQGTITANYIGSVTISGIEINANGGFGIVMSGSNATTLFINECYLLASNNTFLNFTNSNGSSQIIFISCFGNLATTGIAYFSMTGAGVIGFDYCQFNNTGNSITANTITSGTVTGGYCLFTNPFNTSSTGTLSLSNTDISTAGVNAICTTFNSSGINQIVNCTLNSGSAAAISMTSIGVQIYRSVIASNNSPNAIIGTGTLSLGEAIFVGTALEIQSTVGVTIFRTTVGSLRMYGGMIQNYTPTAVSYQVLITDQIVGVTSNASARTITMPSAGLIKGQRFTVKDEAGTAGSSNNITISGNGANIDGAATFVITNNYQSVDLYWNGTQFYII